MREELPFDSWKGKDFSLFQNVQAGLLYSGQWELIPHGVELQNETDHSLTCSAEARKLVMMIDWCGN